MAADGVRAGFPRRIAAQFLLVLPFVFIFYFLSPLRLDTQFSEDSSKFYGNSILEEKAEQLKSLGGVAERAGLNSRKISDSAQHQYEPDDDYPELDVMITFKNAKQNTALQRKFHVTVSSLLEHSSTPVRFHIMGDSESQKIAEELLLSTRESGISRSNFTVAHYNVDSLAQKLESVVRPMQEHFSHSPGAYFSDVLFFISMAIHRVMPEGMKKVIMLDADLKFKTDIRRLYELFKKFLPEHIIGIAYENQPVYRHVFWEYRSKNPGTRVGEPPPDGFAGFNSGVLLLDVERMRRSTTYNAVLDDAANRVHQLTQRYRFRGHLGDQDFFTLLALEHSELFYVLPCGWNRQLCRWWEDKGYAEVFDAYYRCEGDVHIYHGNCNTAIP